MFLWKKLLYFTCTETNINRRKNVCSFWENTLNDPKLILNAIKSKVVHIWSTGTPWVINCNPLHSRASWFWVTGHLATRITPKWLCTLQWYPIYILRVPNCTIFTLHAILRNMHSVIPNWLWTLQGQMYPTWSTGTLRTPNFVLYHCTISHSQDKTKMV